MLYLTFKTIKLGVLLGYKKDRFQLEKYYKLIFSDCEKDIPENFHIEPYLIDNTF